MRLRSREYLGWGVLTVGFALAVSAQSPATELEQHSERARQALARHDLEGAIREYSEILKLDPDNAQVQAAQGIAYYGQGKFVEARAALKRALQLRPLGTDAEVFLGLSESALGLCQEAVPRLQKSYESELVMSKLKRLVGVGLADCYSLAGEQDRALQVMRGLRKAYPEDPDILYKEIQLYSELWNRSVSELLGKHSDSYRFHQVAGEVLEIQGKYSEAAKEYRLALAKDPRAPGLHYRLGQILQKGIPDTQTDEKALAEYRQELAINPNHAESEYAIGEIAWKNQQLQEALMHYLRALQLYPHFVEARVGLGKTYIALRQSEKAIAQLEEAVKLDPENEAAHYNLMVAYRNVGRKEDAQREHAEFQRLQQEKNKKDREFIRSIRRLLSSGGDRTPDGVRP